MHDTYANYLSTDGVRSYGQTDSRTVPRETVLSVRTVRNVDKTDKTLIVRNCPHCPKWRKGLFRIAKSDSI